MTLHHNNVVLRTLNNPPAQRHIGSPLIKAARRILDWRASSGLRRALWICEAASAEGPTDCFIVRVLILRHDLTTVCSNVMMYEGVGAIANFYELHRQST